MTKLALTNENINAQGGLNLIGSILTFFTPLKKLFPIGRGDRSDKIRTYNWPQNRVTDHRLEGDAKNYPLTDIVAGSLDGVIAALKIVERAARLEAGERG